jgi:hypothetical protein
MHARGQSPFCSPRPGDLLACRPRPGRPGIRLVLAVDKEASTVTYLSGATVADVCHAYRTGELRGTQRHTSAVTSWAQWCCRVRARLVGRGAAALVESSPASGE